MASIIFSRFISYLDDHMATKLIQAIPGMPKPVTDSEVERFLESKLNMQLAALDEEGYPISSLLGFIMIR
jgi:hypothetical protein